MKLLFFFGHLEMVPIHKITFSHDLDRVIPFQTVNYKGNQCKHLRDIAAVIRAFALITECCY